MKEHTRNVLVGLFMLAALGALGLLMAMFGETPEWLGGAEWPLEIHVKTLQGAPVGTPVKLNGVQIGRVGSLRFDNPARPDMGVSIIALINEDYEVPLRAHAVIYGPVLGFGRGRIEIAVPPGTQGQTLPKEGARITGETVRMIDEFVPKTLMSNLDKTVVQVGSFADTLTPVANDLHEILRARTIEEVDHAEKPLPPNLHTVMQRLDQTLKHVNEVVGDPQVQDHLRETVGNLHQMSEDGRVAVADFRATSQTLREGSARITTKLEQGIDQTTTHLDELSRKAMPVLDQLAGTAANLNRASGYLADGQGTAGKLLRDDRLYEKMVLFFERVTAVINTIGRIADQTERQGYIDLAVHEKSPLGPVPVKQKLYDPGRNEPAEHQPQ